MQEISSGATRTITGNNKSTCIAVNHGTLRVTGNLCHITVLHNLGSIVYSGVGGNITVGRTKDQHDDDNNEGHVYVTATNTQITVLSGCQRLRFVGTGCVLRLAEHKHALDGCVNLLIRGGRICQDDICSKRSMHHNQKVPNKKTRCIVVPGRCSVIMNGCSGLNIKNSPMLPAQVKVVIHGDFKV